MEKLFKRIMEFDDYFNSMTGGQKQQQYSNWIDVYFYKNGYRITHTGGIIPERYWEKDGEDFFVRMNDFNGTYWPVNEAALESAIAEIIHYRRKNKAEVFQAPA